MEGMLKDYSVSKLLIAISSDIIFELFLSHHCEIIKIRDNSRKLDNEICSIE